MALMGFLRQATTLSLRSHFPIGSVARSFSKYNVLTSSPTASSNLQIRSVMVNFQRHSGNVTQIAYPNAYLKEDHRLHWISERIISAGLLAVIPATFIYPTDITECVFSLVIMMHTHMGLNTVVEDYMRPAVVGKFVAITSHIILYVASVAILAGLLNMTFDQGGLIKNIKALWYLKPIAEED